MLAGDGDDEVTAGDGNNIVFGDFGQASLFIGELATTDPDSGGGDDEITTGDGNDVVLAGDGDDDVAAGDGDNIVFGDFGRASLVIGMMTTTDPGMGGGDDDIVDRWTATTSCWPATAMTSSRSVTATTWCSATSVGAAGFAVLTSDPGFGGDDEITAGDGNDIVLAGDGDDDVDAGDGNNVVLGDLGVVLVGIVMATTDPGFGGDDEIITGDGDDIVLAGDGNDIVLAGDGDNIVLGDLGQVVIVAARLALTPLGLDPSFTAIATTSDPDFGGDDVIVTGDGNDWILGGPGIDFIAAGDGDNVVLGDLGSVSANEAFTTDPGAGDRDVILTGDGDDWILGGDGDDAIVAGDGDNVVVGDLGSVTADLATTSDPSAGGNDVILDRGRSRRRAGRRRGRPDRRQ